MYQKMIVSADELLRFAEFAEMYIKIGKWHIPRNPHYVDENEQSCLNNEDLAIVSLQYVGAFANSGCQMTSKKLHC